MAEAFWHFAGAGEAEMNFRIKAVASDGALPQDAAENTVAVISETAVNGYRIGRDLPADPAQGTVWIRTGEESEVAFEALKENGLEVRPLYVKQYVQDGWTSRDAWIFREGSWLRLSVCCLYDRGDGFDDVTGGWTVGESIGEAEIGQTAMTLTTVSSAKSRTHVATRNPVDLTPFRTLRARVQVLRNTQDSAAGVNLCRLGYGDSPMDSLASVSTKAALEVYGKGQREISFDISDVTASAYVILGIGYFSLTVQVERVWLER